MCQNTTVNCTKILALVILHLTGIINHPYGREGFTSARANTINKLSLTTVPVHRATVHKSQHYDYWQPIYSLLNDAIPSVCPYKAR